LGYRGLLIESWCGAAMVVLLGFRPPDLTLSRFWMALDLDPLDIFSNILIDISSRLDSQRRRQMMVYIPTPICFFVQRIYFLNRKSSTQKIDDRYRKVQKESIEGYIRRENMVGSASKPGASARGLAAKGNQGVRGRPPERNRKITTRTSLRAPHYSNRMYIHNGFPRVRRQQPADCRDYIIVLHNYQTSKLTRLEFKAYIGISCNTTRGKYIPNHKDVRRKGKHLSS